MSSLARTRALYIFAAAVALMLCGIPSQARAADCIAPDDPPGCSTPAPSVTPEPTPTPSVTVTAPVVQVVTLDQTQFGPLMWGVGALLTVSLATAIAGWGRL